MLKLLYFDFPHHYFIFIIDQRMTLSLHFLNLSRFLTPILEAERKYKFYFFFWSGDSTFKVKPCDHVDAIAH